MIVDDVRNSIFFLSGALMTEFVMRSSYRWYDFFSLSDAVKLKAYI